MSKKLKPGLFNASSPSIKFTDVLKAMENKGYALRARGEFDLNVVGVRRTKIKVDAFNDVLFAFFPYQGQWQYQKYQITTLPGYTYLAERLGNSKGTAILVPGHYKDKYEVRQHGSGGFAHQALCQKRTSGGYVSGIKVWRDDTLDAVPNPDTSKTYEGGGINIHRASASDCTVRVADYSAGCQVFRCVAEFDAFMTTTRRARDAWGNTFSYTLLDEADL
ncbi:MAG TPA: hypothetical protein DIT64_12175 [Verrucomicrobiales bacterium]|nr:hypothetical protein [Verrucomicrobiales bacterium]